MPGLQIAPTARFAEFLCVSLRYPPKNPGLNEKRIEKIEMILTMISF